MICWPKRFLYKFSPYFSLQNDLLQFVSVYKYLGVLITHQMSDDDEMVQRMRIIYSTGNMIVRKFSKCSISCKLLMFQTFLSQVYGCALWATYKVASYKKVKVSHNDIFRSLLNVPRYESASSLFTANNVRNLDSVIRTCQYSLMCRVSGSSNSIVRALVTSSARVVSCTWHRWSVSLGRDLVDSF